MIIQICRGTAIPGLTCTDQVEIPTFEVLESPDPYPVQFCKRISDCTLKIRRVLCVEESPLPIKNNGTGCNPIANMPITTSKETP